MNACVFVDEITDQQAVINASARWKNVISPDAARTDRWRLNGQG
jgi:hypothetical protein